MHATGIRPPLQSRTQRDHPRGAARAPRASLFIERGYAETATPDIVAAAGVTRGALYHHFADKQALFHAVVEQEAAAVAAEIERAAPAARSAAEALLAGGDAYLEAMREAGRTRLLLLDGPAVLGREAMDAIDNRHGNRTLREGLVAAMQSREIRKLPLDAADRAGRGGLRSRGAGDRRRRRSRRLSAGDACADRGATGRATPCWS